MTDKKYVALENLGVTSFQRSNLEKLYARTERFLPDPHFTMGKYSDFATPSDERAARCGTVACFAGHGPKVGVQALPDDLYWDVYLDRVFGDHELLWEWLFDSYWQNTDDTLAGARKRLRIALDLGIPEDYYEQKTGEVPLEYDEAAV